MDAKRKANVIRALAKGDDRYYALLKQLRAVEKEYHRVLGRLSRDDQDIVCDYISKNEELSGRMLEIACEQMVFIQR